MGDLNQLESEEVLGGEGHDGSINNVTGCLPNVIIHLRLSESLLLLDTLQDLIILVTDCPNGCQLHREEKK